jgi:hypothetical protein
VQPYFVLRGNVCALLAAKDHVNLFLYNGGIVPGLVVEGVARLLRAVRCAPSPGVAE